MFEDKTRRTNVKYRRSFIRLATELKDPRDQVRLQRRRTQVQSPV